ncbi:MAG: glycosyltransferase family protein [Thermoplasmataceae archaeon]
METDTYIQGLKASLDSVGVKSLIYPGVRIPHSKLMEMVLPPIVRNFLSYGNCNSEGTLVHDTRGDSVFSGVSVSTITDLYWNHRINGLLNNLAKIAILNFQNYKRTLKISKKIIVLTPFVREEIKKFYGKEFLSKVQIVPVPVEAKLTPISEVKQYDILWVGSTLERKRLLDFFKIIKLLPKHYRIAIKLTYGNRYLSYSQNEINNLIINLKNWGWHIELFHSSTPFEVIDRLYRSSKCIVSTSVYEGFHMPIAEAYLRGTNIVIPTHNVYTGQYSDDDGIHWYSCLEDLPKMIDEAIQYGNFYPSATVRNYLSFQNVGRMLREVYETAEAE